MPFRWTADVTIPNGATGQSAAVDFGGGATRVGLIMPATWVAAGVSFQVSNSAGGTYTDLRNEAGTLVELTVAQGNTYALETSASVLSTWRWVKVRSGTTAIPVNQTADRVLTFTFQR